MTHAEKKEFRLRLDNIEATLSKIAGAVCGNAPGEVRPGSAAISMIARELVNAPELYAHRRKRMQS